MPTLCRVFGTIKEPGGQNAVNATVICRYPRSYDQDNVLIIPTAETANTDLNGFVEINLYETETLGLSVTFQVQYTDLNGVATVTYEPVVIPKKGQEKIERLLKFRSIDYS